MKSIEELIDDSYDKLFKKICEHSDSFCELLIEYKGTIDGKTIRRSWKDREKRLTDQNSEQLNRGEKYEKN